jgi:DNA modification methylase
VEYADFLVTKNSCFSGVGFEQENLNSHLFPFQRDIVKWALKKGRAAIWADCGMGKTIMQLEWAHQIARKEQSAVLIVAPLAVASQTVSEGVKFGIDAGFSRGGERLGDITVCNYEMLDKFNPSDYCGVVIDESSILKSLNGKTRSKIIEMFSGTPYRLACTATPAPNDFMELGNHSQFLGIMSTHEMLAKYFYHDGGETQDWTLKGHAENEFWKWICSWAVIIRKPSDIGHEDGGFVLPVLNTKHHKIKSHDGADVEAGTLFKMEAVTLNEQRAARRATKTDRVSACVDMINKSKEEWVVWGEMNDECDMLEKMISSAVQVSGSDDIETKEERLNGFSSGKYRVLITKPKIAGFGMNWQHCRNVAFVGVTHSFEQYYQAIRRCWRFGQKRTVNCHVISADIEGPVLANLLRKEVDATSMIDNMIKYVSIFQDIHKTERVMDDYKTNTVSSDGKWEMRLGDCVETIKTIAESIVDYSIFSPPFASLYTYSNSMRDMGNCRNHSEFYDHFKYLVVELLRVIKPGRLLSFHCMNLPTSKARDGYIGITDFRGMLIKMFQDAGWIYHSEVVIWKDPVTAMQRTKALGLLHKQLKKDSAMSRQGIPDYLVTMRKPGANPDPVTHTNESFPVDLWQQYASPIWMDIRPSRTLQKESAREDKDEKHICPLQLDVIERALALWTNPGDLVLSPFAGIGSEGYCSLLAGRRFVGLELKESYFKQACENLRHAQSKQSQSLFD